MQVAELWRYPVKSMAGERLDSLAFDARRARGDRLWAVRDLERDVIASARRLPALLRCRPRYLTEPGSTSGPGNVPSVAITVPDGTEVTSDDPRVHELLSTVVGRAVRLEPLGVDRAAHRLPWRERAAMASPSTFARDFGVERGERLPRLSAIPLRSLLVLSANATPPGSFVDLGSVHLVTTSSLASAGTALDDGALEPCRFRPNVVVAGASDGWPENDWVGATVVLGDLRLRVTMRTVRCVVPSREHAGAPLRPPVTRAVAVGNEKHLGVYADVDRPAAVAVGDAVEVRANVPPGPLARLGAAVVRRGLDAAVTGLDLVRRTAG